jgi:CSLREA domain-containing protein
VDGQGNVYVADTGNHRIQKFTSQGAFITQWGGLGSGDGKFNTPSAVDVGSEGTVFVADTGNHRIQSFTSQGTFISTLGSQGTQDGEFSSPQGVAFNGWVADTNNHRLQRLGAFSGGALTFNNFIKFGSQGNGDGQFNSPQGLAASGFVADTLNHRIQHFSDQSGIFLGKFGALGTGDRQFNSPSAVAVGGFSGIGETVYVADTNNHRIQHFLSSLGTFNNKWGTLGSGDGQFNAPRGVAVDGGGNIYVADTLNHRIQKFSPPPPATYTVNSTGDGADSDLVDGLCNDGTGACTLRAAIQQSESNPGKNTIAFNIPGQGPHTIRPSSPLYAKINSNSQINFPIVIDGFTQPGSSPNTNPAPQGLNTVIKIEVDGSNAGKFAHGFLIVASNSTVRGLAINNFGGAQIALGFGGNNRVSGNFLNTAIAGTTFKRHSDHGSDNAGIGVSGSSDNVIGGTDAASRNLIVGGHTGIEFSFDSDRNLVQGNLIGTDRSGAASIGGINAGGIRIRLEADNNTIGGTDPGAGNVVAFNSFGIEVSSGIKFVGDTQQVLSATGNTILGNLIHSNGFVGADRFLGIDLGPLGGDGVTPNDAGDGDTGANNLQNFPVLTSAVTTDQTAINGTLNSTPNTQFKVEFFHNTTCNPSGHGEGEARVASSQNPLTVTTDGSGNVDFGINVSNVVPGGRFVTATATDPNGNTSEFSRCKAVTSPGQTGSITGLQAVPGNSRVTLTWSPVSGATSYVLYMAATTWTTWSEGLPDAMRHPGITSTNYLHDGLTNGVTYYFAVASVGSGGESPMSTQVASTPTAPSTGGTTINGTVTLQGRTPTLPEGVGHGITTVTLIPGGVTVNVNANGSFQFSNVANGTFTLTALAPGYVSRQRTNVVVAGAPVTLPSTELRCGLVNNDNFVNINDITATVASFGRTLANRVDAQGWFVDQNGDGFVNINDITCVVSGFGVTSPLPWE